MNIVASARGLLAVAREDRKFQALGLSPGRYLRFHYRGRWHLRRASDPPVEQLRLKLRGTAVSLRLNAPYGGTLAGVFLENEYDCSSRLHPPPARILDLGANIGFGSIYLNVLFPNAEYVAVEPDPRNIELLKQNLQTNHVRARVIEAAVASEPGTLRLRFGVNPTCSALESSPMHDLAQTVEVTARTVPSLLAEVGWDEVDLVKIDIEGTEDELLSRDNSWLERVRAICIEIHPNTTPERISSYLAPYGFRLTRVGFGREPVYFASRS
jgi:FkbM family methyltransferase